MFYKNIFFKLEATLAEEHIISKFNLRSNSRNLRYSTKLNTDLFNFVGFVVNQEDLLVVLPKHYISSKEQSKLDFSDINLTVDVILHYFKTDTNKDIGSQDNFETNYPFDSFYEIYMYYKKYGLYLTTKTLISPGLNGQISWKDTFSKSNKIISNNTIIYYPFQIKKNITYSLFITECMVYVINKTLMRFNFFLKYPLITDIKINEDIFSNKNYVIENLKSFMQNIFKDHEKRLILSLIRFFEEENYGGSLSFKHYDFQSIWEKLVDNYLNSYFVDVNEDKLIFSNNFMNNRFKKEIFYIDSINEKNNIQPDHYLVKNNKQYIFDSKYYKQLTSLDYKQISYYTFLSSLEVESTVNALILPTEKDDYSYLYFSAKQEYNNYNGDLKIIAQFLNIKKLMQLYIKN